jgi:uncharacterized protein (TIGR02246 family)
MASTVRELLQQSEHAVRSGDLSAVGELYHPNAALHKAGASLIVGREAIVAHFAEVLSQQPEDVEHEVTEEHIHLVTSDLAIVDTVGTSRSSAGNAVEGFTMIAVRDESGEWLWAGLRAALVPN